jgi:hypothetical protein
MLLIGSSAFAVYAKQARHSSMITAIRFSMGMASKKGTAKLYATIHFK